MRHLPCCIAVSILLLSINPSRASLSLQSADEAFQNRVSEERARFALSSYEKLAEESQEKDPEILWRVSMASYFVGLRLTKNGNDKERIFARGRDSGLAAIRLKSESAEAHFWTAINMALYGDTVGVFKMLFSLQEIRGHLKESLKINPAYAHGGAYRLLGLIDERLPGILGGNNEEAREFFQKAIEIAPDEPLNYQFLAQLEHDELHTKDQAIEDAKRGLAIQGLSGERLESIESQADLRKLIQNWAPEKR